MLMKKKIFLLFLLNLNFGFVTTAQTSLVDVYNWFDSIHGDENAELYSGILFVDEFKVTNEKHRFFKTDSFVNGTVSYNGNTYYHQDLKYDLLNDELLVKPKTATSALILQIVKNKIDSFSLKDQKFIKLNANSSRSSDSEFYEKLSENKIILLLKKHSAINLGPRNEVLYYEFRYKSKFFIYYKNEVFPANTKNDIIAAFPEQKKMIRKSFKKNKLLRKANPVSFMQYLSDELETFHSN